MATGVELTFHSRTRTNVEHEFLLTTCLSEHADQQVYTWLVCHKLQNLAIYLILCHKLQNIAIYLILCRKVHNLAIYLIHTKGVCL